MELKRELGARDLTLFAIAGMAGARWLPAAAHAGSGSVVLWLLASLLFLIPLSVAIATLTLRHPAAGGMYLWARADYGPWHGFLCFWIYWMGTMIWFPSAAMFYVGAAGIEDRTALVAVSLAAIWAALGMNIVGVKIGKWTENSGAIAAWTLVAVLIALAFLIGNRVGSATHFQLLPDRNWGAVNLWASIAYAVTGFEVVGMMGAEIRNPTRDIPRAAWISSIFITVFYAAGTAALLVILRPERITELNGLAQTAATAGGVLHARWLTPLIAVLVLGSAIGQFGGLGASVARMPFAAGADHLLPAAFAKLHPRWATPHVAMISFGALASVLLIAIQFGDTARAAYDALVSLMVIAGFLPFIYIFGSAWKAGKKLSAISGWFVTLVALVCSVVPPEGTRAWLFELKLALGTAAVIGSAFLVYRRYPAHKHTHQ
jgi:amino acid transporter